MLLVPTAGFRDLAKAFLAAVYKHPSLPGLLLSPSSTQHNCEQTNKPTAHADQIPPLAGLVPEHSDGVFVFTYSRTSNGKSLLALSKNTQYLWFNPSQQLSTAHAAIHASRELPSAGTRSATVLHTKPRVLVLMFSSQPCAHNTLCRTSSECHRSVTANAPAQDNNHILLAWPHFNSWVAEATWDNSSVFEEVTERDTQNPE